MITHPSTVDPILEVTVPELDEIWQIDQKIKSLEEQLRHLRAQRNSKAAVSRLPVEIMVHIFTYCVPRRDSVVSISIRWLSFTYVCHSWRSIALNHAGLWTCIDFQSSGLAQVMLERSNTAVLDVNIPLFRSRGRSPEWPPLLMSGTIRRQLSRIGHLHMDSDHFDQDFMSGLVEPAPSLRSLEVTTFEPLHLPRNFLAGTAPLLTQLRLDSTYLPWDSPLLHTLNSLELRGDGITNVPTGKQFFDALQNMPLLEILILHQMFPSNITDTNTISLPNLRELQLSARSNNLDRCNGLIGLLSFPETTVLEIEYCTESGDAGIINPLLSHLCRIFSSKESPADSPRTIRALSLELNDHSDYTIIGFQAWNVSGISFGDGGTLPPCILHLRLARYRPRSNHSLDDLKAVLVSFPLNTIETLEIRGFLKPEYIDDEEGDHTRPSYLMLIEHLDPLLWLTSVKRLVFRGLGDYEQSLCAVLGTTRSSDSSMESLIPAFPAVHTLVLMETYVGYPLLPFLTNALRMRMKHGHKLGKLSMSSCRATVEELAAPLKEVIDELDWIRNDMSMENVSDQETPESRSTSV